jgi:hypothetical protein
MHISGFTAGWIYLNDSIYTIYIKTNWNPFLNGFNKTPEG